MTSSPHPPAASDPSGAPSPRVPTPLQVAIVLVCVEALVLVGQGVSLLPALQRERLTMGLTSVVFFVFYGVFLALCAWQLRRLRSWARAPVVLAQLIQILVGTGFWGGSATTTAISVVLVASGVVVLAGVFHPASLAALSETGR